LGNQRFDADDWKTFSDTTSVRRIEENFKQVARRDWLPENIIIRESRDSVKNPNSTPIILAFDVTGSMGMVPQAMITKIFGPMLQNIIDRGINDPAVLAMAVGDVMCDSVPLQVSQFESGILLASQCSDFYLEGGGGGNSTESYNLPWVFAAQKTITDSMEKRNKKGFLFTFGDELAPYDLSKDSLQKYIGGQFDGPITSEEALKMAEESYEVYHLVIQQGSYAARNHAAVMRSWRELMGERVINISDYTAIGEVVCSILEFSQGKDKTAIIDSWQGPAKNVVEKSLKDLVIK